MATGERRANEEVRARVIHSAPGGVSEADVQLAKASGAPILRVQCPQLAKQAGA